MPGDQDPPAPWLDMSQYPSLDPDQAIDPLQLETLRDALHAAYLPALPLSTLRTLLDEVAAADGASPAGHSGPGGADPAHEAPVSHHEPGLDQGPPEHSGWGGLEGSHLTLGHTAGADATGWSPPGHHHGGWSGDAAHSEPGPPGDGIDGIGHHHGGLSGTSPSAMTARADSSVTGAPRRRGLP